MRKRDGTCPQDARQARCSDAHLLAQYIPGRLAKASQAAAECDVTPVPSCRHQRAASGRRQFRRAVWAPPTAAKRVGRVDLPDEMASTEYQLSCCGSRH